jgi:hypothetical protein
MAKFVLHNVRMFAGGADLTTVSTKAELTAEAEEKDTTAFSASGQSWKESLAGIRSTSISASGQWEAGDAANVDDNSFASLGAVGPVTVCPATAADGSLAWLTGYLRQDYTLGGAVGDVAPWSGDFQGNWPLARGLVVHAPAARTATGTSSIQQIVGGVPTGKFLVATLHVLSVSGTTPSVTGVIQSATTVGFGSPTTRISFSAATAIGGQVFRLAGPLTDEYYRLSYTISGTTPSLLFMSAVGVA